MGCTEVVGSQWLSKMGQFDDLPGVFYLAKLHRNSAQVSLTYEEYQRYLRVWEEMTPNEQVQCLVNARKGVF